MIRLPIRPLLVAAGLTGLAMPAGAADWQGLLGNSPFGQAAPAAVQAPAAEGLEFRGVVQEDDIVLVNVYNPSTKVSHWLPTDGQVPGLQVTGYDAKAQKLQVTQAGRPLVLELKQAKIALLNTPPPAPAEAPGNPPAGQIAPTGDGVARPGRNLPPEAQAMVEEIRRRRALRQQQTQQRTGQPAVAVPAARPNSP